MRELEYDAGSNRAARNAMTADAPPASTPPFSFFEWMVARRYLADDRALVIKAVSDKAGE